ncbi:DUF7847 domain-containing protein [Methanoplanus endosymbiosus]|uniref:DUF7847 domain-containing protein n=1 Tax=Methanoplanus endosymbiosus TaxID=33865 RepID=A0A9E7PN27_9EURY|nr:hypothetical protein [Methanoplanus endosymbiosus]UUX91701.1 hypothetical protein L6E24_10010 [Methanoplanus endosymbiosus]
MGFASLHEGLKLLKHPVLWIAGIVSAIFSFLMMWFSMTEPLSFYGDKLLMIWLVTMPFFIAATYGSIKSEDYSVAAYFREGLKYYFRVLLPAVFISFAAFIFIFIVMLPGSLAGASGQVLSIISGFIFFIPCLILVFFFDTAAVFSDLKVFESIKKSITGVMLKPFNVAGFFLVLLLISLVLLFGLAIIWSGLLADELMPLTEVSAEEMSEYSANPELLFSMLGDFGVMVTSLIYSLGSMLIITVMLPFKAVFYRKYLEDAKIPVISSPDITAADQGIDGQGEYDEKGRWYKYS